MRIRDKIAKFVPAFRARDAIIGELHDIEKEIDNTKQMIKNLDSKNEYLFYCLQRMNEESTFDTKKRFFLNMPRYNDKISDLQMAANYILQRVKRICDDHQIQFFLCAGTLLGAERHHGFIPWDDDIDIIMFRDQLKRLQCVLENDPEICIKRVYREHPGYVSYIYKIKFRKSDTFFVDIFQYDYFESDESNIDALWNESESISNEFHKKLYEVIHEKGIECNSNTFLHGIQEIDQIVDELENEYINIFLTKLSGGKKHKYMCMGVDQASIFRKTEKIRDTEEWLPALLGVVTFEGKEYDTFKNYKRWLELQYGDIWALPRCIEQSHENELTVLSNEDRLILQMLRLERY